jgi:glycine betaine/proline transport system permease protein
VLDFLSPQFPTTWRIPLRSATNEAVRALLETHGDVFRGVTEAVLQVLLRVERFLVGLPWWLVVLLVALVVWHATDRSVWKAALLAGAMIAVGAFGLWNQTMITVAIMLVATTFTVIVGIPVGVAMARSDRLKGLLRPLLDAMQTLPSFVYLVPVVMFFGLGNVAAIIATFVYAAPPIVRLTDLGLRLVDREVVEAAEAFGASEGQTLWWVRMPLALPTIMAGINQTIMMALAMVVVASMIGARGLGQEVLRGLQRGDVGYGLEAGLAIVVVAVIMDRVTAGYGRRFEHLARQADR